jgi:hypothetical protein
LASATAGACQSTPVGPGWTFGPRDEQRSQLVTLIEDVVGSDGHVYDAQDDVGHWMDTAKIVQLPDSEDFVAIYHSWVESEQTHHLHLATSADLLHWTWRTELARQASMGTIAYSPDGGVVLAWEQEPENHLKFAFFDSVDDMFANRPAKTFEPPRQLSTCAEGTPSLYSATRDALDVGFHYFRSCDLDREARGRSDWRSWDSAAEPALDASIESHGVEGGIGDRDGPLDFGGAQYMLFEGMLERDNWETWRIFLHDVSLGSSLMLQPRTHGGSHAFTNPTIGRVTLDGRPAMVVSLFVPGEAGVETESGQLIYYRFID